MIGQINIETSWGWAVPSSDSAWQDGFGLFGFRWEQQLDVNFNLDVDNSLMWTTVTCEQLLVMNNNLLWTTVSLVVNYSFMLINKSFKQVGAELCQAQLSLSCISTI